MKSLKINHNWACTTNGRESSLDDNCDFKLGDRVTVSKELPENMAHFNSCGKSGVVTGRNLTTDCGIVDYGYYPIYVLHLDGEGESAWYPESTLVQERK